MKARKTAEDKVYTEKSTMLAGPLAEELKEHAHTSWPGLVGANGVQSKLMGWPLFAALNAET